MLDISDVPCFNCGAFGQLHVSWDIETTTGPVYVHIDASKDKIDAESQNVGYDKQFSLECADCHKSTTLDCEDFESAENEHPEFTIQELWRALDRLAHLRIEEKEFRDKMKRAHK